MTKNLLLLFGMTVLFVLSGAAQDKQNLGDRPSDTKINGTSTFVPIDPNRSSPFKPPKEADNRFIKDEQPGSLDTRCAYRSEGPFVINLPIDRVIDKNTSDGTISEARAQFLIEKGYLSQYATIQIPAYDVDEIEGEVDKVYFNGTQIGTFSGSNNRWKLNEFRVPIHLVKFGKLSSSGGNSIENNNVIKIEIDTASSDERWCTTADWVSVSFKAMSPIVLLHGNTSDGTFYSKHEFTNRLDEEGLLYDNSINLMPSANTIEKNAAKLGSLFRTIAKKFGVDSIHLVTHSKGGLDTREFLERYYVDKFKDDYKILSFTTLGTPHNGSPLADLTTNYINAVKARANVQYPNFTAMQKLIGYLNYRSTGGRGNAGHPNLRTDFVADFNYRNIPALWRLKYNGRIRTFFNTVAGDADKNNSGSIDTQEEYIALTKDSGSLYWLSFVPAVAKRSVDASYQLIRNNKEITIEFLPSASGGKVALIRGVPNPYPMGNDVLVTLESGRGRNSFEPLVSNQLFFTGGLGKNHSSIADREVAGYVIPWFRSAELYDGDLK